MESAEIAGYIVDAVPYPIVFADAAEHVIRYMNKAAKYHYHQERGYSDLIGRSIFDCHNESSRKRILAAVEKLKNHGNEIFLGVSVKNQRIYMVPVRDEKGDLIGYFERFELNMEASASTKRIKEE